MTRLRWQDDFEHRYELHERGELPGTGLDQYQYPAKLSGGSADSVIVEVIPMEARPWCGVFFGTDPTSQAPVALAWPDGDSFAIVVAGSGYIVRADDPAQWTPLEAVCPIQAVQINRELRMVVFSDFTRVAAYGRDGLVWVNEFVSWDGITLVQASATIEGTAWDAPTGRDVRFVLDAKTGQTISGVTRK